MSAHSFHPDTHEHGLADGCPRCAEHAADPFPGLDDRNLRALRDRTTAWMNDDYDAMPRSENELLAMREMEKTIRRLNRIMSMGVA